MQHHVRHWGMRGEAGWTGSRWVDQLDMADEAENERTCGQRRRLGWQSSSSAGRCDYFALALLFILSLFKSARRPQHSVEMPDGRPELAGTGPPATVECIQARQTQPNADTGAGSLVNSHE